MLEIKQENCETSCETFSNKDLRWLINDHSVLKYSFMQSLPGSLRLFYSISLSLPSVFSPALKIDTIFDLSFHWVA